MEKKSLLLLTLNAICLEEASLQQGCAFSEMALKKGNYKDCSKSFNFVTNR